jgi:hypothetical protein
VRAESRPRAQSRLDLLSAGLGVAAAVVALATLLGGESVWTRWLVLVPAAVGSLPLVFAGWRARQRARVVAAVLLVCWCLLAIASVGILYLPSAIAMIVAAVRGRHG